MSRDEARAQLFKPGLTTQEQKYCHCVLEVAAKNEKGCNKTNWGYAKKCVNPYSVCHASVKGVGRPDCGSHYDYSALSDEELLTYIRLQEIPVSGAKTRENLIAAIQNWKGAKGY